MGIWLMLHVKLIKRLFQEHASSEIVYIHSSSQLTCSWWSNYIPSITKPVSKKHQVNVSYSRSSFTRSILVESLGNKQINKRQGDQIQFSSKKDCRKKKMGSSLLSTLQLINSTRIFFICLNMIIMLWWKKL